MLDLDKELLPKPIPGVECRRQLGLFEESGIIASTNNEYRYALWRLWDKDQLVHSLSPSTLIAFVMLNPSTADEVEPDPTINKCVGFCRRWGFKGLVVVNLFALRSTDPSLLNSAHDPVGPHNAHFVRKVLDSRWVSKVVIAWGNEGALDARDESFMVVNAERDLYCLEPPGKEALTKLGAPRHPVRLGYNCALRRVVWNGTIATEEKELCQ